MQIFSEDADPISPTQTLSATDLKAYVFEGQTIGVCGQIDLDGFDIDMDLNITIPLSIEIPYKPLYAGINSFFTR